MDGHRYEIRRQIDRETCRQAKQRRSKNTDRIGETVKRHRETYRKRHTERKKDRHTQIDNVKAEIHK
jgi:hypothetical protein